jgi:hypothetical protein
MRQTVGTPRGSLSGGPGTRSDTSFAPAHQTLEPRTVPPDTPNRDPAGDRSQHGTLSPGEEALRAESDAKMQPVPQRDRADGLPYTERVS